MSISSRLTPLLAMAAALSGCGSSIDSSQSATSGNADVNITVPAAPTALSGQAFADKAAASDAFEVASATLALGKSPSRFIKAYAEQIIDAHTKSTATLKAAAAEANLTPVAALPAVLQARLDALTPLTGAAFEKTYAAQQIAVHEAMLGILQDYGASGDVSSLRTFANDAVPAVEHHLEMARDLHP